MSTNARTKKALQRRYFIRLAALMLNMVPSPPSRGKREDRIDVRIDERTRAAFEEVKEFYGFKGDADAIRGMIAILKNREKTVAEVEGRVAATLRPYVEEQIREYGRTEEYKDLVRALVDEVLKEEIDP